MRNYLRLKPLQQRVFGQNIRTSLPLCEKPFRESSISDEKKNNLDESSNKIPRIMDTESVCVLLYWDGRIVQIGGLGLSYDPPVANAYIVLDNFVSYDELVNRICDCIGINANEYRITLTWKRAIQVGYGFSFVGIRLCEAYMRDMFATAIQSGQIELFVDYQPQLAQQRTQQTVAVYQSRRAQRQTQDMVTYDVGTSRQNEVNDEPVDFGDGGPDFGDGGPSGQNELSEESDGDMLSVSDKSTTPASLSEESANESADGEPLNVPRGYVPVVSAEQSEREYVDPGLPYFRTLPTTEGNYYESNYGDSEDSSRFWDEKNPTQFGLGTKFDSKLQLKTAVTLWHLESSTKEYTVVESKPTKWNVACKYPKGRAGYRSQTVCIWKLRATLRKHDNKWEIRQWVDRHTCAGNPSSRDHANFSSAMVAVCIRHHILKDPEYKPKSIIEDVKQRYHVDISYKKAWYGRRRAIELAFGGWESSFEDLPSYMLELQKRTRGTVVEWHHDERHSTETRKFFKYVFWAFGPCLEAFQHCKPVLTVDGTHLRGRLKGKLLIAVGFDANKKCLPVAYAIVDNETNHSWNWFMELIKLHVMKGDRDVCIISDRHQGLINAMESDIWKQSPRGYHRFCLVHVRKNVLQHHKGVKVKGLVWLMGIATQKRKYVRRRRALGYVSPEAVQYLQTIDAEQWTMAFDKGKRWGEATTNMVEAYNNVLRGARDLPIRACIDITFWRTIEWFQTRSTEAAQCQTDLTPWAHNKFENNDARGRRHEVRRVNIHEGRYDVLSEPRTEGRGGLSFEVRYLRKSCSCGKWQMWRLPCSHAAAVARDRGDNVLRLVSKNYLKSTWEKQYSFGFRSLRHQDYWEIPPWTLECSEEQLVPRSRGRYRRARIHNQMDVNEPDQPRRQRSCQNCGQVGHDRRSCTTGRTM